MALSPSSEPTPGGQVHLEAVGAHLEYAAFLKSTLRDDPVTVGWAITALFYAAVHSVRGYLKACKQIDVSSHDDFRQWIQKYPELKRTSSEYDLLKQQSQSARYYCNPNFTWTDVDVLRKKAEKVAATWRDLTLKCLVGPTTSSSTPTPTA